MTEEPRFPGRKGNEMNAKEIMDKKFEKGFNGYKMDDVDDFLREISIEFSDLQAQNESLEKKLEVLADKIREYRNDEDAIKNALLIAQKESAKVVAAAKEKAEEIISEAEGKATEIKNGVTAENEELTKSAEEKAHKLVSDAEAKVAEKEELIKKLSSDAESEKAKIEAEYREKEKSIIAKFEAQIAKEEAVLTRTRKESQEFCDRMLGLYKSHIELVKAIPEQCDNEFVKNLAETVKEEAPAEIEEKPAEEEETAAPAEEAVAEPAAEEERLVTDETADFKPMFEEADVAEEELFATKEVEIPDESAPFFTPEKHAKKYEKLEFGKNNQ